VAQSIPPTELAYLRAVQRAIFIARDLETCRALLRGESVPVERLDFEQARRFARR